MILPGIIDRYNINFLNANTYQVSLTKNILKVQNNGLKTWHQVTSDCRG